MLFKNSTLFTILIISFFLISCTKYYIPIKDKISSSRKYFNKIKYLKSRISYSVYEATVLKNGSIITIDGVSEDFVDVDERLISYDKISKNLFFYNDKNKKLIVKGSNYIDISLYKDPISASLVTKNIIAILYRDNSISLYYLPLKKEVFNISFAYEMSSSVRIPPPFLFNNKYLVYPLLSGKLAIYNIANKKVQNIVEVTNLEYFKNFIFMLNVEGRLLVSTMDKLAIIDPELKRVEISRDISPIFLDYHAGFLYVLSTSGELFKYKASNLELVSSLKLDNARYIGLKVYKRSVYLLEDSSYLIRVRDDLSDYKVFAMNGYTNIKSFSYKNHILYGIYDLTLGDNKSKFFDEYVK